MKLLRIACLSAALLAGASFPLQAQSLLGIVGDKDSGALVTLGSGAAGTSGAVNVGLGGGGGNVLDAKVGNGSIGSANIASGGGSALSADVGLLNNNATLGLDVGGDDLLDVDVGIGGGGGGNGGSGGGGGGSNPVPGGNGGVGGGGGLFASAGETGAVNCAGISGRELERLILATRIDGSWRRATNVNVRRVEVCPELRPSLAAALRQTGLSSSLRSAISSDALVAATLDRLPYSLDRVFAVRQSGRSLTVFVY